MANNAGIYHLSTVGLASSNNIYSKLFPEYMFTKLPFIEAQAMLINIYCCMSTFHVLDINH